MVAQYASLEQEKVAVEHTAIKSPPGLLQCPSPALRMVEEYRLLGGGEGLSLEGEATIRRTKRKQRALREAVAFWTIGILNNTGYVIMMAAAKDIESGGVGLVFLFNVLPSFLCKLTGPYWFHYVPYAVRIVACAGLMAASFVTVGCGTTASVQLIGVGLTSLQSGLGEASLLALSALYDSRAALTFWSSGTGAAGIAGYAWVYVLHYQIGLSLKATLLVALALPVMWLMCYFWLLGEPRGDTPRNATRYSHLREERDESSVGADSGGSSSGGENGHLGGHSISRRHLDNCSVHSAAAMVAVVVSPLDASSNGHHPHSNGHQDSEGPIGANASINSERKTKAGQNDISLSAGAGSGSGSRSSCEGDGSSCSGGGTAAAAMTAQERWRFVLTLWPYMVPLFLVYAAEYTMQSGAWSAIGFPVTSEAARNDFFELANWTYQAGVFASRSSGLLFQARRRSLWLMPLLQCALLGFFCADAVQHWWYNSWLLSLCLLAGLLGGAVYVNAFTLIAREVNPAYKEFALGAASLGDSLGIIFSSFASIFVQACLYKANDLQGAIGWC